MSGIPAERGRFLQPIFSSKRIEKHSTSSRLRGGAVTKGERRFSPVSFKPRGIPLPEQYSVTSKKTNKQTMTQCLVKSVLKNFHVLFFLIIHLNINVCYSKTKAHKSFSEFDSVNSIKHHMHQSRSNLEKRHMPNRKDAFAFIRNRRLSNNFNITWPIRYIAETEGDIILGGLMMVHEREDRRICGPIMPQGGIQALECMLYTMDWVNNQKNFLPGIKLGAYVLDDCDKDTYGLEQAVDFIKGRKNNI